MVMIRQVDSKTHCQERVQPVVAEVPRARNCVLLATGFKLLAAILKKSTWQDIPSDDRGQGLRVARLEMGKQAVVSGWDR